MKKGKPKATGKPSTGHKGEVTIRGGNPSNLKVKGPTGRKPITVVGPGGQKETI